MSARKATVIGGQGFIGRTLVSQLRQSGWQCWVQDQGMTWPETDRALGHVFYCAGLTSDYLDRPADTVEAHVSLLSRVLQSVSFESLVYLSSTRLYDGVVPEVVADEGLHLSVAPHVPRHLFDLTKLTGECLCHVLGRGKARIARLSCVYDFTEGVEGFLPDLLGKVAQAPRGTTVAVDSSAHFARDYVHVSDVVRALVDIALHGTQTTYNIASGENVRNDGLAQLIEQASGRRISFSLHDEVTPPALVNIARLKNEFGWMPAPVQERIGPWLEALF